MTIEINGARRQIPEGLTVSRLLADLKLESRQVAVEVNLRLVPRQDHSRHALAEGDRLEIVSLVGGG